MIEVIPAIIAKTPDEFSEMVAKLEPYATRVSIDIMDGLFVPNKTIAGYIELNQTESKLLFDAHLMVQSPENQIDAWLNTRVERIFLHLESSTNLKQTFEKIRQAGKKCGLVLNPETNIELAAEYTDYVDYMQFMTVHPGFYGGTFIAQVVDKIKKFHELYPRMPIVVDGGMEPDTAKQVVQAGATILISGGYVLKSNDIAKAIQELQNV